MVVDFLGFLQSYTSFLLVGIFIIMTKKYEANNNIDNCLQKKSKIGNETIFFVSKFGPFKGPMFTVGPLF